jgi:signal transduction histidine kinase
MRWWRRHETGRNANAGGSRRHTLALAIVLSLTLLLVGALGLQAWRSTRTHRTVAEGVLRDYASFAAWNYAYRVRSLFMLGATPVLGLVYASQVTTWPGSLNRMRSASDSVQRCKCAPYLQPTYFFRLELATGRRYVEGVDSTTRAVVQSRLDAIRAHARERSARGVVFGGRRGVTFAIVGRSDRAPWVAFYTMRGRDSTPEVIDGFEAHLDQVVTEVLEYGYKDTPFFPRTLVGEVPNDSIVSLTVLNASGTPLYRTPTQYSGGFTGRRDVFLDGVSDGAFVGVMVINPAAANRLLIGGLPQMPITTLLVLVTATVALIGIAFGLSWRASELARQRTDFTSSVSHELRTPLTQILLYGEMLRLRRTRSDRERSEAAYIIVRETQRLIHLVDNVLHFSRAERRIVRVAPRGQLLEPLLRDIIVAFEPLVQSKGTHITMDVRPALVARVDADALRHVMLNLLDNATRYGPAVQTITVGASRAGHWVTIWVDDEGRGVPPEDRSRIWQPFVRLERDMSAASTGSGIGLAVVAELVSLMDGECGVETAPAGGSRFFVRLRGAQAASPRDARNDGRPEPTARRDDEMEADGG